MIDISKITQITEIADIYFSNTEIFIGSDIASLLNSAYIEDVTDIPKVNNYSFIEAKELNPTSVLMFSKYSPIYPAMDINKLIELHEKIIELTQIASDKQFFVLDELSGIRKINISSND